MEETNSVAGGKRARLLLLLCIFVIAVCGLVYELLAGALSSYLLGDSVYQFSIVIGIFMSSMGLGSFLSRYINRDLPRAFIIVELLTGVIGGFSTLILFLAFAKLDNYTPFLFLISISLGTLIGLEIPLILRILKQYSELKIIVSNVLTADYLGALIGAILFPLVFVPFLGLVQTGLFFGLFNVAVAGLAVWVFYPVLDKPKPIIASVVFSGLALVVALGVAEKISSYLERTLYSGEIIYAKNTTYQRLVITRRGGAVNFFINGSIQFCSLDEYRYHESLVHPAMSHVPRHENILILGGGDGLAAREILKYPNVKSISIVDLDPAVTDFFKRNKLMCELNDNALNNPKVKIFNQDAWKFIEKDPAGKKLFDLIVIDLPDPRNIELSKLYSRTFYRMLSNRLAAGGAIAVQAASPLFVRKAYWCAVHTMESVGNPYEPDKLLHVKPYRAYVPSFGEWGFVLASPLPVQWDKLKLKVPTKYLNDKIMQDMIDFPKDTAEVDTDINRLNTHRISDYYEKGWEKWYVPGS
jgi:spermidine synthase